MLRPRQVLCNDKSDKEEDLSSGFGQSGKQINRDKPGTDQDRPLLLYPGDHATEYGAESALIGVEGAELAAMPEAAGAAVPPLIWMPNDDACDWSAVIRCFATANWRWSSMSWLCAELNHFAPC